MSSTTPVFRWVSNVSNCFIPHDMPYMLSGSLVGGRRAFKVPTPKQHPDATGVLDVVARA
jgi:hypothetical protein